MTFMNEGTWDRLIRILAGIALGYAAWMTWPASLMSRPGAVSIVFLVIGAIALVTGLVGLVPRVRTLRCLDEEATRRVTRIV